MINPALDSFYLRLFTKIMIRKYWSLRAPQIQFKNLVSFYFLVFVFNQNSKISMQLWIPCLVILISILLVTSVIAWVCKVTGVRDTIFDYEKSGLFVLWAKQSDSYVRWGPLTWFTLCFTTEGFGTDQLVFYVFPAFIQNQESKCSVISLWIVVQ